MLFRICFVVLCLLPSCVLAGDRDPEVINFGPGLYWRYLVVWDDDPEPKISYWIEGFRESGVFTEAFLSYKKPYDDMGKPNIRPPAFDLRATNLNQADRLDIDGDFDLDVDDLNIVRNEFGEITDLEFTGDGVMGVEDLNEVRNNFGFKFFDIGEPPWEPTSLEFPIGEYSLWVTGEVEDSCITLHDARFGPAVTPCAEASPVPEPSTLALAGVALMALSRRIWSRCRPNSRCTRCQVRPRA